MEKMKNNYKIDTFLEIGPNKVLSGIAKRMYPETNIFNLEQPKDLEELAKLL
jgi:malonyl CoA-acyl carrier protein transacylase